MSTLTEDIQALLAPLAAGGTWYAAATIQPTAYPYIVWVRIVSSDNVSLCGPSDMQNTRIQIEAVAPRIGDAQALMRAIDQAFSTSQIANTPLSTQDLYEDAIHAYRVVRDYSVWSIN